MEPQYRFCKSADGTEIGYAILGEGPPLVFVTPFAGEFELIWAIPGGRDWITGLARARTLIHFDRRGAGLSQRDVTDISLEADLADLEAVVRAEALDRFDLLTGYESCAIAVAYAAAQPDRVGRLVLWGPYARGADFRTAASVKALTDLVRGPGWAIARRVVADTLMPSGPAEVVRAFAPLVKATCSPEVFATYVEREATLDISDLVSKVQAPCLVLHRKDSRVVPTSAVRSFAARLPNARLLLLSGDASVPYVDSQQALKPIDEFLGTSAEPASEPAERGGAVATVLFTDIVGHTEMMSRLGDEKGRDVLREHERITRDLLAANGGKEVKTMGDGFMASFTSVTKAVACAIALQKAFAERNEGADEPLHIRIGLNAGEPIEEDGDLFGATVILASRLAAKAAGGEILVSDVVRGLCSGKGFLFSDRGEFVAKGFEEPVRVFDVSWRG
ncbi:MAG: adenylate/guanylate cyclase domain-containing protein [Chloroflexi bacterium]|nr:adenylate/guanylate cyclase domain-containing protein [Chloroflexota bacterium]